MSAATVQVFEHTTVRVDEPLRTPAGGERALTSIHHQALAAFADRTGDRYLHCGRRSVRFTSYVGLIQLGDLGIEILPKADRGQAGQHDRWHRALVRMLRVVGDLGLEAHDEANLRLDPGRLFDLFVGRFLDECERLLHQGLVKGYRSEEGNRTAFRGRLLVAKHIRHNAVNAARFYVASTIYDHRNLPNLALHEALRLVETLPIAAGLRARARGLRQAFPDLPPWRPDAAALDRHRFSRTTTRYQSALRLARLILFDLAPDVRHGDTPLLALLFNMNALWERYVATLARRLQLPGLEVRTQDSRPFWSTNTGTRPLRPDLTLRHHETGAVVLVVDTKWKLPTGGRPSSADVKQMFCYHELFDCSRSLVVYPATSGPSSLETVGRFAGREHRCGLTFLGIEHAREELRELLVDAISGNELSESRPAKTVLGSP